MAQPSVIYNEKERIWSGPQQKSLYNDDTSVGEVVFDNMRNWPKNVCQINDSDGVTLTYEKALNWAIRIAQSFKSRGLTHKDVIGIVAQNSTYLFPLAVACLLNGTPFHSPHLVLDEDTTRNIFSVTKPKLIFCDGKVYEKTRAATIEWQPEIITITDHMNGVPSIESLLEPTSTERFYQPESLKEGGQQTAVIICSSGTTGPPKSACISNQRLLKAGQTNSETVLFNISALDWLSGIHMFLSTALRGSTRIISNSPFEPHHIAHLTEKYSINTFFLQQQHFSILTACPTISPDAFSTVRILIFGGGRLTPSKWQQGQELFKNAILTNAYALTESGNIARAFGIQSRLAAGEPVPGVKIRIVDENGQNLEHNQVGEIFAHTGMIWKGYFGNPEETARMQDSDGWFHTGDLGYFDDQNLLYIVDRSKDTLKNQGIHYSPAEIENIISELEDVREVCVVGIYDEQSGYLAGALIVKREGSSLTAKDVIDHVAKRIPSDYKHLHAGVRFTDEIPANHNGKTLRKAALEKFKSIK
ncbi:luciferin 4-monooxygenase-like [Drosophila ficusphila]|uniref:luciferin 4-monooxygenase-like n=1 Tax=Drosophila ficusphila TaxID=30025 RepID=UPI0007E7E1DF|nr:luciferin 4-monooxygenase-like [Drosophila ficusphila]